MPHTTGPLPERKKAEKAGGKKAFEKPKVNLSVQQ
jgi:hypothetical protein